MKIQIKKAKRSGRGREKDGIEETQCRRRGQNETETFGNRDRGRDSSTETRWEERNRNC